MVRDWESTLAERSDNYLDELLEFVRIPSVSTTPEHAPDVAAAAHWVADRLTKAGVPEVEVIPTTGHAVVIGRWHAAAGKPTVLLYGHFDVQPADPLELWESPPFEPTIRDGILYARGVADMKANLLTMIQAIEALAQEAGAPPVNVTFLFEGEEEIGESHLPEVVEDQKERLKADVGLSGDGSMGGIDLPLILVSAKGIAELEIEVETSTTDLHSGEYGAAVPNAVHALVQLAATFHTPDGKVAIAGFYDDVRELTETERTEIAAYPQSDEEFAAEAGVDGLWGEPGYTALERRGARPTIDFNGIFGGFQGGGTKTVTPARAVLKVTSRLVARQDPRRIQDLIAKHVEKHAPTNAKVTVHRYGEGAFPYEINPDNPVLATQRAVLRDIFGVEPVTSRAGGSVPILEVLQRVLGIDVVTLGFGLPGRRNHAPNENYHLSQLPIARRTYASFLSALAADAGA
jgi:acetylornithine deacetylase/succinyl-diaminopimelate desuccinylase-like protein